MTMSDSVAVIIDSGYLLKEFDRFRPLTPNGRIEADHFRALADSAVEEDEELFRIYCYHCPPYGGEEERPLGAGPVNFGQTGVAKFQTALQTSIRLSPRFAFRTGVLRWRGWECRLDSNVDPSEEARNLKWQPRFEQKEVDIKIGLDIAWLASKRIVDVIAVVSGDTDFVPAMKFARREGVQVRLVAFEHRTPHNNLVEHSDFVSKVDLALIARTCTKTTGSSPRTSP